MFENIEKIIALTQKHTISENRKDALQKLVDYINNKRVKTEPILLNFICTHNSRRSQFTQVWAAVAARYHKVDINTFSGGVEVTACNQRTIESLARHGFKVNHKQGDNPKYEVLYKDNASLELYSKLYDDSSNPDKGFAAIMTCSHADENCPLVIGCEERISLTYEDPKLFDDSILESTMYDARSFQIAAEMLHVFSKIK